MTGQFEKALIICFCLLFILDEVSVGIGNIITGGNRRWIVVKMTLPSFDSLRIVLG